MQCYLCSLYVLLVLDHKKKKMFLMVKSKKLEMFDKYTSICKKLQDILNIMQ